MRIIRDNRFQRSDSSLLPRHGCRSEVEEKEVDG